MVIESGRALVIAMNKADLVDADRRRELDKEIDRDLLRVSLGAADQRLRADRSERATSSPRHCTPRSSPGTGGSRPDG